MAAFPPRRRPRRGSLERPVSGRIYRAAWVVVALPLLVAAFSLGQPVALQQPRLPPSFDRTTAVAFATEFARRFPDRSPGTSGARDATVWVEQRFRDYDFTVERREFSAEVPGRGDERFVNLVAVPPVRARPGFGLSNQTIVVIAHRDNLGLSPGANDNASGTAALLELARDIGSATLIHPLVFVSADAGAYGNLGATEFARASGLENRIVAVVNLDALAGPGPPRLQFAGDAARSPAATLVATAEASVRAQADRRPERPSPLAQLIDLAFPYTLYGQGAFIARGTPAITLTTSGDRPATPRGDTLAAFRGRSLDELGRSAQALLGSLDAAAEVARGTDSYVYAGTRLIRGWTIQFVLLAALLPFFAATLDLFARCRRRHVSVAPALRSYVSRLGVWIWAGLIFLFFAATGILPKGQDGPISPDTQVAGDWPVAALFALGGLALLGWLAVRPQLQPRRPAGREEELGGHLAAMLVLGIVALVVAAQNPYALIFVLPSLHAWLWLPHAVSLRARLAVYLAGFVGPLLLVGSFALRFDLGLDAPWYLLALASIGYVPFALGAALLAWGAAAMQVGALAIGRYAPFPDAAERPARGPIRESIRQAVLLSRRARAARTRGVESEEEPEAVEES
jgi:hypothetical protein